ncbi:hypothetical protein PA25_04290 [Pseudoalteromonas sp. A25]|uniref:hypothetical protein n=1 Tax=Pseudoalteromonas sp. A25 TaxID=116092 RepID=UPI00126054C3|nr:hypothetical protein [Pseudoalteromonas sp. A25]BBN80444.1 hypothetical protein PA25_04290 [Pseudoalteromonas sp. A25]
MSHTVVEVEKLITDPSHWEVQVMKVRQLREQIRAHRVQREVEAKRQEQENRAQRNGQRSNLLLKSALAMAARNRINQQVVL